jgi:hypothetical protein
MNKRGQMARRCVAQRDLVVRYLVLGWTAERIARKLQCSLRTVRYAIGHPQVQILVADFQRESLKRVDRQIAFAPGRSRDHAQKATP